MFQNDKLKTVGAPANTDTCQGTMATNPRVNNESVEKSVIILETP